MSKADFSAAEFAGRLARLRAKMAAMRLDWLVAIHPMSIHWLTGSDAKSYQEFQCLLVGARDEPLVVFTRQGERHEFEVDSLADEVIGWGGGVTEDPIDALAPLLRRLGIAGRRVGFEVPAYYLHPDHARRLREALGPEAVEASGLIARLKLVKSPAELDCVRRAAALADGAMARFAEALAAGRSELQLAGTVYQALLESGSGIAASPINLVTGPRTAFAHGAPTGRLLQAGDFGNIEFGATASRYTATLGRDFVLGTPTSRMRELHDVVAEAGDAMLAEIRDGVPAIRVHEAGCQVIAAAGLDRFRVHLTGYSLGPGFPPSWAEPLYLMDGCGDVLQAGMVLTIEPPVFIGEEGLGARLIDNVVVTAHGAERLSRFSRDLLVA
jgi:Xaa-Pro dipeptidase